MGTPLRLAEHRDMNPIQPHLTLRRSCAVLAAAALAAALPAVALPAAAQATGTIVSDGTTLTFTGDGAPDNVGLSANEDRTTLTLNTSGLTSIPAGCEPFLDYQATCPLPQRVVVRLGDGDDSASVSRGAYLGVPDGVAVELYGEGGSDRLQSARLMDGGAGNDRLEGHDGDQVLNGGPGEDELDGGAGSDQLHGDDGDDLLSGDGIKAPSPDLLDGGAGIDRIESEWSSVDRRDPPVSVTLDGAANDGRPGESDNVVSIERITSYSAGTYVGGDGPDQFDLQPAQDRGVAVVQGRGGDDRVVGDDDVEQIDGGPGDDYLEGGYADDTIVGGPGRDRVFADDTGATCFAYGFCVMPFGNDTIDVRDGEVDQVDCGVGVDTVRADPQDVLSGCESVDTGAVPPAPEGRGGSAPGARRGGPARGAGKAGEASGGAGALALKVSGGTLRRVLRDGLVIRVGVPGAGRLSGSATRGGTAVARGSAKAGRRGTATLRLRVTERGAKLLRGGGSASAKLTVKVRFAPRGGSAAKVGTAGVTLRR